MRGTALHDRFVLAGAALFLCAHLVWLPGHLEDIDAINFALGVGDYDVAAHQPHPPGYPVLMLLAKAVAAALVPVVADPLRRATIALAVLAAVAGAMALLMLYRVLRLAHEVDSSDQRNATPSAVPVVATLLTAVCPLFWITAARPLSDMPGLAGALACQWLLLRATRADASRTRVLIAAAACGIAVGLRSQVTWLVVPLLVWFGVVQWRRAGAAMLLGVAASSLAGVLVWAIPMVQRTGGLDGYRAALASQAGEDFDGVPMLFLQPGLRRLATTVVDSFVTPWAWWPLAVVVLALAAVGVLVARRGWLRLTWLTLGTLPYLVFHLLFQETETTRYALPLVPWVATLAAIACVSRLTRAGAALVAVPIVASSVLAVQAHGQYVSAGVSVGEVLTSMQSAAREAHSRTGATTQVLMHRRVWAETRRVRGAMGEAPYEVLAAPRSLEWRQAVPVWEATPAASVWWLVDPRRGDRVAVDPRALTLRARVAWPWPVEAPLGGMRPHAFDWYDVRRPQWVLLDGWGLTPELAGLSAAAGQGPSTTGATARVAAWADGGTLVIGGRHVAPPGAASVGLDVRLGDAWTQRVDVPPGDFVAVLDIPALPGDGYRRLDVRAASSGPERVFLEQFDAQPRGVPVLALESGWYEPERDVVSGRTWRWTADRSTLRVAGAGGGVRLTVEGTWPRHYDRDPVLEMYVGEQRVATHVLARPFRIEQTFTDELLRASGGRIAWRVSPSFVAGERTGTQDARRLALEIASLRVDALR